MTPVTHGDIAKAAVLDQVHKYRECQNAVRNQVQPEPVEHTADQRAGYHNGQPYFRIEILPEIKIRTSADGTVIDLCIGFDGLAECERQLGTTAAALDGLRRV